MFVMSEIHLVRWIWVLWGTEEGFVLAVNAAIYTYIAMRWAPFTHTMEWWSWFGAFPRVVLLLYTVLR